MCSANWMVAECDCAAVAENWATDDQAERCPTGGRMQEKSCVKNSEFPVYEPVGLESF